MSDLFEKAAPTTLHTDLWGLDMIRRLRMEAVVALIASLALAAASDAADVLLDNVPPGGLANWTVVDTASNPSFTASEVTSPFDGSTAIQTSAIGSTTESCEREELIRTFDVGPRLSDTSLLTANLAFSMQGSGTNYFGFGDDGLYWNFPYVSVQLRDGADTVVGAHYWYGKNLIGGYHLNDPTAFPPPTMLTQFPTTSGTMVMNLAEVGPGLVFTKITFRLHNYTCMGRNSIVVDNITLNANELAQCQIDLNTCAGALSDVSHSLQECGATLAQLSADTDADGVRDLDDSCDGTSSGQPVDKEGCSLEQFCGAISVQDSTGRQTCRKADWRNDEPLMRSRDRDCAIHRGLPGVADDRCTPAEP